MFNIETALGNIHYGENIIRKIINKGIERYEGRVIPYNVNNKLKAFVGMRQVKNITPSDSAIKIIRSDDEEDNSSYEILIHIVVKFGTSINDATNGLIDYIYEYCDKITRTQPTKVTVKVTGVLSKNLVKREIEVSR